MFYFISQNLYCFLCLTLIFLVLYEVYFKRKRFHSVTRNLPTVYGIPFIGIAYKLIPIKNFLYIIDSYFEKFKSSTFCAWLGPDPFIITIDPDIIKMVTTSEDFLNKSRGLYTPIDNAIHNGIITSPVLKWKHNRKLMNSSFRHKVLTSFIPIFNKGNKVAIDQLNAQVGYGEQKVFDILKSVVLEIAIETTMGVTLTKGCKMDEELLQNFNFIIEKVAQDAKYSTMSLGFVARSPKYYNTLKSLRKYIENLIKMIGITKEANDHAEDVKKNNEKFINQALRFYERGLFQLDDVIIESITMIAGSFETVSTTIYSTLVMLAMHSDIQQKLFEEVLNVFPNKDFQIEYEHLQQVPYLDMIVDETLRLMPAIPVIGRQAVKDTKLTEDIFIHKNMQIIIPIFNLHRCKDIWGPLANLFNPDNFLPENISRRHPYAYTPFSKGARNCIGWRYARIALSVILLGLVRNFKFTTSFKYEDLVFVDHVSLFYDVEPMLTIESRP